MSFSELNYKHQVIVFELDEEISALKSIEIPLSVPLQRIPQTPLPLHEVLGLLDNLPIMDTNIQTVPFLEVRVLLDGPEPALRHKIETALAGKRVRLAKIDVKYPVSTRQEPEIITPDELSELQPIDVFGKVYQARYNIDVPKDILQLFKQVAEEVNQTAE
jgi:exonuclease SbcD